jgi:glycogen debranching enzyme
VELSSGYGLRTMTDRSAGYDPLSYHCGSVWTHDTAIAVCGLARTGASPEALTSLVDGLLTAAPSFGFSMPELYGGRSAAEGPPLPYPASCRPQAWAAAAGVAVATALAGIRPDVPAATLDLRPPLHASAAVPFDLLGVRVGESILDVSVRPGPDGHETRARAGAPPPLRRCTGGLG